jgi:ferric-dicitrate binding protein FerR (iron transport regulator)
LNREIENLIAKYCVNQLNSEESKKLNTWLEQGDNRAIFQKYIEINYNLEESLEVNQEIKAASWKNINTRISTSSMRKNYWRYGIAASVVALLGLVYFLWADDSFNISSQSPAVVIDNNIEIGTDKATLTLEDGTEVILEKGRNFALGNVTSDGEKVVYKDAGEKTAKKELAYNYLTVPRAGEFYMELSDNTKVWVNSDSQIKYPKEFLPNQDRVVELLYGEAYFEVSPSTQHNGAKFIVNTNRQEIEVLGTQFNVKAYTDEHQLTTTLVEGKVNVDNGVNSTQLAPNQQSIIGHGDIILVKDVKVYDEIAWKEGIFSFKGKSLKDIMTVLSRWYDVDVEFEDESLEAIKFIGVLNKNQNIEQILLTIKNTNFIKDYEINEKTITLK